ncbi:MAG: outer membrane beta-barrel protein [Verrucomicrobiales bacterium]|nr:outer membrane beta-barrel protein [Verrucomicrobiales bacterium]
MSSKSTLLYAALTLALGAVPAMGQGLLAMQQSAHFDRDEPLNWTIGVSGGYDSLNYNLENPAYPNIDSYFIQGGIGATYSDNDRVTPWSLAVNGGVLNYLDEAPRARDTYYSARVAFNIAHQVSERLKFSNNFYGTYEAEPNYAMGASTTLWNGQYFYGYNNFNLSYAWSRRFSSTTSYTVDTIRYQQDFVSASEDRLSHLIAQQFAYQMNQKTALVAEYRYRAVDYMHRNDVDSHSHFVLAGINHAWSQRTTSSARAGAEFYKSGRTSKVSPYAEFALNYQADRKTTVSWFSMLGYDGTELQSYSDRYSFRTGINAQHAVDRRLTLNGGLSYVYSKFGGNALVDEVTENSVMVSAGVNYLLWENFSVNAGYGYTILKSSNELREFDRNRVTVGMSATF